VYTLPRHEKKIAEYLPSKDVDTFCPVYTAVRDWNGRRAQVQLPLFSGYVFVRIGLDQRVRVLEHPSVLQLVGFGGKPAAIPDAEMDALRSALSVRQAKPHPFLAPGRRVRVRSGVFAGLEGTVIRRKGTTRFVISVASIQRSIAFDLDSADIQAL
jgi:transcription antitermination factor NusG